MTKITLPPDVEGPIVEEARKQGTTAERLVVDSLRRLFPPTAPHNVAPNQGTLADFLAGHIGTVDGVAKAYSEKCGDQFTDLVADKHASKRP